MCVTFEYLFFYNYDLSYLYYNNYASGLIFSGFRGDKHRDPVAKVEIWTISFTSSPYRFDIPIANEVWGK